MGSLRRLSGFEQSRPLGAMPRTFGQGTRGSGPKRLLCMCSPRANVLMRVMMLYRSSYSTRATRCARRRPLRWFGPLTMRDGLRTSETEHDEFLLGPFQPDDGLAWHASVPPNFPDGDTDNAARLLCCSRTIRCLVPAYQPRHDSSSRTRCLFALEPMLPSFDARWLGPEHQRPNLRCANSEGHLAYSIQDLRFNLEIFR